MMLFIFISFYATMVIAGWLTEAIFSVLHFIPRTHHLAALTTHISLNHTTVLNIAFILVAGWLVARFIKTGALPMLKMMD